MRRAAPLLVSALALLAAQAAYAADSLTLLYTGDGAGEIEPCG